MSIGSIASTIWAQTTQVSATLDTAWSAASPSPSVTGTPGGSAAAAAGQTGSVEPFQQLASDIQALLVQAQGGTGTAATAAATTATTATDPEQQLATDLQSIMNQLQGSQTGAQTASAEQTGATGQAHGHHHHHHHEDTDTDASAATEASATTSATTTTASASNQAVSQTLAADIMQALQAYGGTGSTLAVPTLTA